MLAGRFEMQKLAGMVERLSSADKSVLAATLQTPGSQIATVKNSPNDILWSKMVELGFAREMTLELDLPAALQYIRPRSFALTELGRTTMSQLLAIAPPH
jgi:hypothetical protein